MTGANRPTDNQPPEYRIGGAQIHLQQVRLRTDILIDEVHLDGTDLQLETAPTASVASRGENRLRVEATKFTAMMSEPNLNVFLAANVPPEAPVRNLKLILLSGKARISGQFVKSVMSLPFTLEAIPKVEQGVRVVLDCQTAKLGISLPGPVVDVIEQQLNRSLALDLSKLPFPVRLDDIRCEPGRLSISGQARIVWPPLPVAPVSAPFSVMELSRPGEESVRLSSPLLPDASSQSVL